MKISDSMKKLWRSLSAEERQNKLNAMHFPEKESSKKSLREGQDKGRQTQIDDRVDSCM